MYTNHSAFVWYRFMHTACFVEPTNVRATISIASSRSTDTGPGHLHGLKVRIANVTYAVVLLL